MKRREEKPYSISQFQNYISNLYRDVNEPRPIEYLYSYLFRTSAYLSRIIGEQKDAKEHFIKVFSWLFAISEKLNIDLEHALVRKYPNMCPYCMAKPCVCVKTGKKPVTYIPEWKISEEIEYSFNMIRAAVPKLSLDEAVKNINDLYPANKHIWNAVGPTFQFFRLLEELGEVHEAYTSYLVGNRNIEGLSDEIADVFAWLLSTWGINCSGLSLGDEFIGYYYNGCPVCLQSKCQCPDHRDRGERLLKIENLMKFKNKLEELVSLVPDYKESLDDLIGSIDTVAETKSTTGAVRTVSQAKKILNDISDTMKPIDETAKTAKSIIGTLLSMAKTFGWM